MFTEKTKLVHLSTSQVRDMPIDCGFKDRLAQQCQDILKDRGLKNTSIDYLVDTVTPKVEGLSVFTLLHRRPNPFIWYTTTEDVPAEIKAEFLEKLRRIVYEDDDNTEDEEGDEEDDGHKDDEKDEAKCL